MNYRSLAIAAVAAWIVDSAYGFLVFGLALIATYLLVAVLPDVIPSAARQGLSVFAHARVISVAQPSPQPSDQPLASDQPLSSDAGLASNQPIPSGAIGPTGSADLGTGIGTAVFYDGVLIPNTELGHLKMGKKEAEQRASDSVRQREGLSWGKWAQRLDAYLGELERLLQPDLFILGGGVSKRHDRFLPLLTTHAEIVPATLLLYWLRFLTLQEIRGTVKDGEVGVFQVTMKIGFRVDE